MQLREIVKYYLVPPVFIVFFTWVIQYLAITGRGEVFTTNLMLKYMMGNVISWTWTAIIFSWAFALAFWFLKNFKFVLGPQTPSGAKTIYAGGGFFYYCLTFIVYLVVDYYYPVSELLYDNFPQLLGSFNLIAFALCIFLFIQGKFRAIQTDKLDNGDPLLYQFYRGVELHPYLSMVNVKQLTNCRIGMMGWQIYITAFFFTSLRRFGFNPGSLVNFLLQTIYIAKFFWWEDGYFHTLDMMLDRAGYYLCWGCLVWVPCLYTYSSYYIVHHQPHLQPFYAFVTLILGVVFILLNYRVDYEKEVFRESKYYGCKLWGQDVTFIKAEYKVGQRTETTALLTSGFWGIARHMNYTFELLSAFSWCSAGGNFPATYAYFFFLFPLLIHRTFRDERKCKEKYGKYWDLYCAKVPYRLLPPIW